MRAARHDGRMAKRVRARGLEYLGLATELLQRTRLAHAEAGVWEAADLQWWWRMPRRSDSIDQLFWIDDKGPVAAVVLTVWGRAWQCDPILVPGVSSVSLSTVWTTAVEAVETLGLDRVEVLARDDDSELLGLLCGTGFISEERSWISWMEAQDGQAVAAAALPEGFALVNRAQDRNSPHPMRRRNGECVEVRLRECTLYDPALDLAVEAGDGQVAGYALFWLDPVTGVGLVEPMRVEDAFQRRGLARAMLTAGLHRLVMKALRGARRLKVGFGSEEARRLYVGAGFRVTAASTTYRWERPVGGRP